MAWKIELLPSTEKQLQKLDRDIQKRVIAFLYKRLLPTNNPRLFGKALTGRLSGYWSYRVGDYRIIARLEDHRRQVYG